MIKEREREKKILTHDKKRMHVTEPLTNLESVPAINNQQQSSIKSEPQKAVESAGSSFYKHNNKKILSSSAVATNSSGSVDKRQQDGATNLDDEVSVLFFVL